MTHLLSLYKNYLVPELSQITKFLSKGQLKVFPFLGRETGENPKPLSIDSAQIDKFQIPTDTLTDRYSKVRFCSEVVKKMVYNIVQYGCGPIGCSILKLAFQKPNISIVGAIDLANAGRDIGEVAGLGRKLGIAISKDASRVLSETKPSVVIHSTGSVLNEIYGQLESIISAGANIVSTCEELSYPYKSQGGISTMIDSMAKRHNVTVLGTGVNPGFLMDAWPLFMTGICQNIEQVKVVRIQDASFRRLPFQKKIGVGQTLDIFNRLVEQRKLRHVGLRESVDMIAAGLGWELDDFTEHTEPIIAQAETRTNSITVQKGHASGIKQVGYGWIEGKKKITLDFRAYIGAKKTYDVVYLTGTPNMEVVIKGGTPGDLATAAMVVNAIPRVSEARPGLLSMKDLPLICALPNGKS
jgi:hypothetical protein